MDLAPCPGCRRHVHAHDASCPFCHASLSDATIEARSAAPREAFGRFTRAALAAGVAAGASMTLAACYGGPPRHMPAPKDRVWDVAASDPKGFVQSFQQKATAQGCSDHVDEASGRLHLGCGDHAVMLQPYDDHVQVTCQSRDLAGCEQVVQRIAGDPAATESSVPPVGTIAPPGEGDAG